MVAFNGLGYAGDGTLDLSLNKKVPLLIMLAIDYILNRIISAALCSILVGTLYEQRLGVWLSLELLRACC